MPAITVTDDSSLQITGSSSAANSTLNKYLEEGLVFALRESNSAFRNQANRPLKEVGADNFPVTLSANAPAKQFKISTTMLNIDGGASAAIDLLVGDHAKDFLKSLGLDSQPSVDLISFCVSANLESGPQQSISDFSFGLSAGQEIAIANYCRVAEAEPLAEAVKMAISGVTIPHDLDDLRSLPENCICQLTGKGTLKFTASAHYNFLNNSLASLPLDVISQALDIKAQSGATLQIIVEHTSVHELTVASLPGNKLRLRAALIKSDTLDTTLDVSLGITANIAGQDALAFLLNHITPNSEKELESIREALPVDARSKLSGDIKKALDGACEISLKASLTEAFEASKEANHLFVYELDLNALDADSTKAVESALHGDFTQITAGAGNLAGIREIDNLLTLTGTHTHTLTIHLIGILNCRDVSSFMRRATAGLSKDSGEIVLAAEEIKIVENNLDSDHLREVLLRSAMITTAAASSPASPNFTFKMVFFLRRGQTSRSDIRQFANVLRAAGSPDANKAEQLLGGTVKHFGPAANYLSLDLNKDFSLDLFRNGDEPRAADEYVSAGQAALAAILRGDDSSANRLGLASVDPGFWKQLRDAGTRQNVLALLATKRITDPAAAVDFFSIDWWATAMARVSSALANKQSLQDAEKSALKKSEGGFDTPWALLATYFLLGRRPPLTSQFTIAPQPAEARAAGALAAGQVTS